MDFTGMTKRRVLYATALSMLIGPWVAARLCSQEQSAKVMVDARTLKALLARVDQMETREQQLEARVRQLEAEKGPAGGETASATPAMVQAKPAVIPAAMVSRETAQTPGPQAEASAAGDQEQAQTENAMERMDVSRTLLRIRGFGDISLHGDSGKGDTTSFSLGQLDLFVTSDVSEKFKFLSEIVFEAGSANIYGNQVGDQNSLGVDLERYLMLYSYNDYFKLSVGRGHTAIGYYNTEFHHSSWLQTTTGRPFLFEFEDHGGILPIHMVGVSASGQIPSGALGLHYVAEIGNGRASREPLAGEPVQNEVDDQNRKAFNLAMFARPESLHGLQAGFSFYHDVLAPQDQPRVSEWIYAAHAILVRPRYEWLNEVVLDRHAMLGTPAVYNTPAFYSQISRQFGSYRPYARYEYMNASRTEPVFPDVGLRQGPSLGIRYDPSESVALKLQYDYKQLRDQPAMNGLTLQMGFTF